MNNADKTIVKTAKIIAGCFILFTVLAGYQLQFSYAHELTFLSNTLCGMLLLSDGIVGLTRKKTLPAMLYQMVLPCILTVFCTVFFKIFGWFDFNFSGMFFFMHGVNPLLVLVIFLFAVPLHRRNTRMTAEAFCSRRHRQCVTCCLIISAF